MPASVATADPPTTEPVNLIPLTLLSAITYAASSLVIYRFANSPSSKPESINRDSRAAALKGVLGACFNRIGLPRTRGGIADLKGIQNGKFHGTISKNGPLG